MLSIEQAGERLLIQVWEDDNDECQIRKDPQFASSAWSAVRSFVGGYTAYGIVVNGWFPTCEPDPAACWIILLDQLVFSPFTGIISNLHEDDYVGELVPPR